MRRLIARPATSLGGASPPRAAVAFIFGVVLLDLMGMSILLPVQPYVVRQYSADALMVTLLSVVYAAAQFFAAPILGKLSDRVGRRPVLLLSLLGSAVGYIIFGIGGALWVLFLSRLIDGITGGNIATALAYIADVTPPQERAKNFGLLGAAFGLGFILGPALGGVLSHISLSAPAYAAATLSLLSVMVGYVVLPESLPSAARVTTPWRWGDLNPFVSIGALLRRPVLNTLLVTQCLFNFATMGFHSIAPIFLIDHLAAPPESIAWILLAVGIANVVVQARLMGPLVKAFGERKLAVVGLLSQASLIVGMMSAPALWLQYPLFGLGSAGAAPFRPAITALTTARVTPAEQGTLNGVSTALSSLMAMTGPLWAGVLYDHVAPSAPLWTSVILLVLGSLFLSRRCQLAVAGEEA